MDEFIHFLVGIHHIATIEYILQEGGVGRFMSQTGPVRIALGPIFIECNQVVLTRQALRMPQAFHVGMQHPEDDIVRRRPLEHVPNHTDVANILANRAVYLHTFTHRVSIDRQGRSRPLRIQELRDGALSDVGVVPRQVSQDAEGIQQTCQVFVILRRDVSDALAATALRPVAVAIVSGPRRRPRDVLNRPTGTCQVRVALRVGALQVGSTPEQLRVFFCEVRELVHGLTLTLDVRGHQG